LDAVHRTIIKDLTPEPHFHLQRGQALEEIMSLEPAAALHSNVFASDRRAGDRIDVAIWTRISMSDDSEYPARITNISPGGLMLMTPCPAAADVPVRIKIAELGWIDAKVAWQMGDRTGLEFDTMLDDHRFAVLAPYCL
jgi:hypothetical protein